MGGAGAASSATLSARAPAEVAAAGHGGGDLLSGSLRLRVAYAAAPLSSIAQRSHGVMSAEPTGPTVHSQLTRWRKDGTLQRMHDRLREHAREKDGRDREPSAAVIDSQNSTDNGRGWT